MSTKHEKILQYIESLPVGDKISVRQIAKEMQVSEGTAYRAIKEAENKYLEAQGAEKADWNATLTALRAKREKLQTQLDANSDQQEKQYQLWLNNAHPSDDLTSEEKRARLAKRIEEQKTRLEQLKRDR